MRICSVDFTALAPYVVSMQIFSAISQTIATKKRQDIVHCSKIEEKSTQDIDFALSYVLLLASTR